MAEQIRTLDDNTVTAAFSKSFTMNTYLTDWRILLAFLVTNPNPPDCLRQARNWRGIFSRDLHPRLERAFGHTASSHAEMARLRRIEQPPRLKISWSCQKKDEDCRAARYSVDPGLTQMPPEGHPSRPRKHLTARYPVCLTRQSMRGHRSSLCGISLIVIPQRPEQMARKMIFPDKLRESQK